MPSASTGHGSSVASETPVVYLDVCALCRRYDDQRVVRIRLETEAVSLILEHARRGTLRLIRSPAHHAEISAWPKVKERTQVRWALATTAAEPDLDLVRCRQLAEELADRGLRVADAAHLAFAVSAGADFVTCDDRLARRLKRMQLPIWTGNPIALCEKESLR